MFIYGDSYEVLKDIEDNSVDLVLTDPPYDMKKYSTGNIKLPNRKALNNDIAYWNDGFDARGVIEDLIRVLKPNGNMFIFASYHYVGIWHKLLDDRFDTFQFFVWHKTNPPPKIFKNGFLNSCELVICAWNKGHKWNFSNQREMHNFFESPICMGKERLKHPTQKPLKLIEHIINIASNEGDVVLDPFAGVATTYIASLKNNRKAICIEKDENYYEMGVKRINNYFNESTI